jgi:hypothetical protein
MFWLLFGYRVEREYWLWSVVGMLRTFGGGDGNGDGESYNYSNNNYNK